MTTKKTTNKTNAELKHKILEEMKKLYLSPTFDYSIICEVYDPWSADYLLQTPRWVNYDEECPFGDIWQYDHNWNKWDVHCHVVFKNCPAEKAFKVKEYMYEKYSNLARLICYIYYNEFLPWAEANQHKVE